MTKITFETATLADVIKRAASVAPTRGDAFDKAAGIIIKVDGENGVTVMATDTSVFYLEAVHAEREKSDRALWRIPSQILSAIVAKLPLGSGNRVTFDDGAEPPKVVMRCNKTVAKFNLLSTKYYPMWNAIDTSSLPSVTGFGAAVKQVMWASSNSVPLLSGVAIFPDSVCATDRFRMARVEMNTGLAETTVIPGKILSRVIPDNGEVQLGMLGTNFVICPNGYTQIRTVVMAEPYPDISRVLNRPHDHTSHFSKTEFSGMLTRAVDFTTGDRQATVDMFIGKGEVALFLDNAEVGLFGDIADASGDALAHPRHKITFNPDLLRDLIASFPGEVVTMKYNVENVQGARAAVAFTNEGVYQSLCQPIQKREEDS